MTERWISGDKVDPVTELESRLRKAEARVRELEALLCSMSNGPWNPEVWKRCAEAVVAILARQKEESHE